MNYKIYNYLLIKKLLLKKDKNVKNIYSYFYFIC